MIAGSCGYGYLYKDEPHGWDVAAATDFMDGYEDVSVALVVLWRRGVRADGLCPSSGGGGHAPPTCGRMCPHRQPAATASGHGQLPRAAATARPLPLRMPPTHRSAASAWRSRATPRGSRTTTARSWTAHGAATTAKRASSCESPTPAHVRAHGRGVRMVASHACSQPSCTGRRTPPARGRA